jgi:hypothetical protein
MFFRLASAALALVALSTIPLAAGCGGSNTSTPAPDAGTDSSTTEDTGSPPVDGGVDSGTTEGGSEGGGVKCVLPDGGVFPVGTQLVQGTTVSVGGLTSDGYAAYGTTSNVYAVPIAAAGGDAGAPVNVAVNDGSGYETIGQVVLAWTGATQSGGLAVGGLTLWTAAHGLQNIATGSLGPNNQVSGWVAASSDNKYILYFDNGSSLVGTADLYVAGTDGTGKTKLVPGVAISNQCVPQLGFAGDYAVASYCTTVPTSDASTSLPVATITAWSGTGWATSAAVSANAYASWSTDGSGLVAYTNTAGFYVYTAASDASTLIDAAGLSGLFTSDSTSIVYSATDGSIRRSTVATPSPQVVLSASDAGTGYLGLIALSGDNSHLLTYKTFDSSMGFSDLYLSSTAAGSTATPLSTAVTASVYGDPFTADSTHALFFANLNSSLVGDYDEMAVTGTTPTKLGSVGWEGFATTAAKVVFDDNWVTESIGAGRADLEAVDTSAATPTVTKLVSQADAYFYLSADKSKIVYSWSYCTNSQAGLYVTSSP